MRPTTLFPSPPSSSLLSPHFRCDFIPNPLQSSRKTLARPLAAAAGLGARPSKGAMPRPLPDELLEEVLCRLPPHEPAELVRAALVSRRWCRLVSGPGFRRRFCEFHRSPPMLGMICNRHGDSSVRFVPTTAFCSPQADREYLRALDARHGRVLLGSRISIVVWDPITDEERELPRLQWKSSFWGAAVLCSAAAGACDHLDCHHGPFLVVCVCSQRPGADGDDETLVYTYSSDAAAWSDPVCVQQLDYQADYMMGSALVGNELYFGSLSGETALKYNLELRQMSLIQLPSECHLWRSVLTTTEEGALGLVAQDYSKLYMWSRKDAHEVDAIWERRVIIEIKTVVPVDVVITRIIGCADGLGIVFICGDDAVYTIDLKTYKVKQVYEGTANLVFPYVNFYTPALGGTYTGEGPSVSGASA